MKTPLQQAQELLQQAAGDGLNREAAVKWLAIRDSASGQEAEQIGFGGEALFLAASGDQEREWVAALLSEGPAAAAAAEERAKRRAARADALEQPEQEAARSKPSLNWDLIISEAKIMVDLNKEAQAAARKQA